MRTAIAALVLLSLLALPAQAQLNDAETEWYLRPEDGCRLFVQEYGTGTDTVVVLHGGWGAEHSYLLDAFQRLEDEYHLVFYDQRGSLRSPCPDSLISVEAHVADLERLRQQLGLERMALFGHSMGTKLAAFYVERHPDRVKGLVLASPALPRNIQGEAERALADRIDKADRAFRERPEVAAELAEHGLEDPSLLSDKQQTNRWRILFAGESLYHIDRWPQMKGGLAFYSSAAARTAKESMPEEHDATDEIAALPCGSWVILGANDVGGMELAQQAFDAWFDIPGVRTVAIERAAHNLWIDQPEEFRRVLREALSETARCR